MAWVPDERRALVATFEQSEPTAPTLCEGWDVRRLLAHLVAREQEPRTMIGDVLARPRPGQEPGLSRLVGSTGSPEGYRALVARFADGPPRWSPMSWAGEQVNLLEYVIHHEDVRRAADISVPPRSLPAGEQAAIWGSVRLVGRLTTRRAPVGVRLETPLGRRDVIKKGDPSVTLLGEPVELALFLQGRRTQARVEVTGPVQTVSRFERWLDRDGD